MTLRMRSTVVLAAAVVTAAGVALAATPASAASPDVVISQVYGGGGNSGATFTNDFIELYNRGTSTVDLSGWSAQYAAAAGTSYQVTALTGSIAPGARFLIQEAAGAGGTTPLPSPDVTGTINMSGTNGKVALVSAAVALTCGSTCAGAVGVRDFVGYGTANDFEGAAAPALSNTTAALRAGGGTVDTDSNAADFTAGPPDPRGASTPPPPESHAIHEIQGAGYRSPLAGTAVTTTGVVTAVSKNGFWIEDPAPDADPATSEGLFVFTSKAPTVHSGDSVSVSGKVSEFRPGGATNLSTTELSGPTVTVTASGVPLPAPVKIGPGGRVAPPLPRTDAPGDTEAATTFDPATNALDFYESLEGTLVEVDGATAVGPTNRFGELPVIPGGTADQRTNHGGVLYSYAHPNTDRLILSPTLAPVPAANVGDTLPGPVTGVLDYNFGNWMLDVLVSPTVTAGPIQPETTRRQFPLELAIATYNVQNLAPTDPQAKFDRLAAGLVHNLSAPDIVSLEEIQDNSGAADDGTVAANLTLDKLVAAITAAGGPAYQYREIDPINDTTGGQPGGNIRVAFLFRTDRGLSFVDRPGGDATTPVGVQAGRFHRAQLTISPGLIDPGNVAWSTSRRPLVGQFRFLGRDLIVIGTHFNSKGGDQPLMGRFQPPTRVSETQRHLQAQAVRGFVDQIRAVDAKAPVVVLGDLNDFEFSATADTLVGDGYLTDLPRTLPLAERYSYVFEGNSQVLDHILISAPLAREFYQYDIVHINSEFANQTSDHEPQVVRFPLFPLFGLL
ncbi:MAG: nuclease [Actinobacteria bacterium 13_2_20CM_2_71_6]|nr:MAG: nuclease [Actinobacteria bacterium 13_2_20CM_2_71_6]